MSSTCLDKLVLGEDINDSLLQIDIFEDKIAVCSEKGNVSFLNFNGQLNLIGKTKITKNEECTSVCFHKTTNNLFCSAGTSIYLLDIRNLQETVKEFTHNKDEINQIEVSSCNKFLLSADDSGEIKVINIELGNEEMTFKKHENVCFTLKSRPNERPEVVSGGYDCKLILWNLNNCKMTQKFDLNDYKTEFSLLPGMNPPYVLTLGFNNNGNLLTTGLQDGSIHLWNTKKRKIKYFDVIPNAHTSLGVTQVQFIDENILMSGGNDKKLKMWEIKCRNNPFYEEKMNIDHGIKINSFCLNFYKENNLFVCDTTSKLSLYQLNL